MSREKGADGFSHSSAAPRSTGLIHTRNWKNTHKPLVVRNHPHMFCVRRHGQTEYILLHTQAHTITHLYPQNKTDITHSTVFISWTAKEVQAVS